MTKLEVNGFTYKNDKLIVLGDTIDKFYKFEVQSFKECKEILLKNFKFSYHFMSAIEINDRFIFCYGDTLLNKVLRMIQKTLNPEDIFNEVLKLKEPYYYTFHKNNIWLYKKNEGGRPAGRRNNKDLIGK